MQVVQYSRNVNPGDATAEITLDGRPNLRIGGSAVELTDEEHERLIPIVVFSYPDHDSDEYKNAARRVQADDVSVRIDDLDDKSNQELRVVAADEYVDIKGLRSNDDIIAAIRGKRQEAVTGEASLPATAVVGPFETSATTGGEGVEGSTESPSDDES